MKFTRVALLTLAIVLAAHVATAAVPCDIKTVTGTYVGISYGGLWVGSADFRTLPEPAPPFMPMAQLVTLTISADGTVSTKLWSGIGTTWFLDFPMSGTITVNPDCTAVSRAYPFGDPTPTIEKLYVLDNGRQLRGVSQETPELPPNVWISEYYRIGGRTGVPAPPPPANGDASWVMTCTGFMPMQTPQGTFSFGSSMLARFDVRNGAVTGTAVHKVGEVLGEGPFSGTWTVNADWTVDMKMDIHPTLPAVFIAKAVLYDEGKRGFGMPFVAKLDVPGGGTVDVPMPARACRLDRQ